VLIRLKHDKSVPPDGCRGFGWCLTGVPADAWHSRAWGRWAWLRKGTKRFWRPLGHGV